MTSLRRRASPRKTRSPRGELKSLFMRRARERDRERERERERERLVTHKSNSDIEYRKSSVSAEGAFLSKRRETK